MSVAFRRMNVECLEPRAMLAVNLITDMGRVPQSSSPSGLTVVDETLFFSASHREMEVDGRRLSDHELWKSDGTPEGTVQLADIWPGPTGSFPQPLAVIDGEMYFSASDPTSGRELWKTDGTEDGTQLVADIYVGPESSSPSSVGSWWPPDITSVFGGALYFQAKNESGFSLWRSDGTSEGTMRVADVIGKLDGMVIEKTVASADAIYFVGSRDGQKTLWSSNGTNDGTSLVAELRPNENYSLLAVGEVMYFGKGRELWRIHGANVDLVATFEVGDVGYRSLVNVGGTLYIQVESENAIQLWKSDGIPSGTSLVRNFSKADPNDILYNKVAVEDTLLFWRRSPQEADRGLWKSDGTPEGTQRVFDVRSNFPVAADGLVYFIGFEPETGHELWRSNGTPTGTYRVKDISPGRRGSLPFYIGSDRLEAAQLKNMMFFSASGIGMPEASLNLELWKTDGTEAGTGLFKEIAEDVVGSVSSSPHDFTTVGDRLLFITDPWLRSPDVDHPKEYQLWSTKKNEIQWLGDFVSGMAAVGDGLFFTGESTAEDLVLRSGLWWTDGTARGTRLVELGNFWIRAQIGDELFLTGPGGLWWTDGTTGGAKWLKRFSSRDADKFTRVGNNVFFTLRNISDGSIELWTSNGTPEGTRLVSEAASIASIADSNGVAIFAADDGASGIELWSSDGSVEGTQRLRDINPGSHSSNPGGGRSGHFVSTSDLMFFTADDGVHGKELWVTDGTSEGTTLVKDIRPGSDDGALQWMRRVGESVVFTADDGVHGRELWVSDGTTDGTHLVKDIQSGPASGAPSSIIAVDGGIVFTADDGTRGKQLWKSDGSEAGTSKVHEVGGVSTFHGRDGRFYFLSRVGASVELWRSDGTASGTQRIAQDSSFVGVTNIIQAGNSLAFTVESGEDEYGEPVYSVWMTDGTDEGTRKIFDAADEELFYWDDTLYFSGDDGIHGFELMAYQSDFIPGDANRNGLVDFADFIRLSTHYGQADATWAQGDFDGDGLVSFADFILLSGNYGSSAALADDVAVEPPPLPDQGGVDLVIAETTSDVDLFTQLDFDVDEL